MTANQHNPLLDAVDLLTLPRKVRTLKDPTPPYLEGEWHEEEHPPLLVMLLEGAGSGGVSGKSPDPGIPFDADALEMWGQVRDMIRLWCKQLVVRFDQDELLDSIRRWYQVHANRVRAGLTSEVIDLDVTRMVEGWVRMIEYKFDPPKLRQWTESCPAWRQTVQPDGEVIHSRCDSRWVIFGNVGRFAIGLNITAWTAECCVCSNKWESRTALSDLRYESNLWEMEKAEREAERMADLERLVAGDTPQENIDKALA